MILDYRALSTRRLCAVSSQEGNPAWGNLQRLSDGLTMPGNGQRERAGDQSIAAGPSPAPSPRRPLGIGLVLADPYPIVLDALEQLFGREDHFTVLARCPTGEETLAAIREHRPHVLILDLDLPGVHGLKVMAEIKREKLPTSVVLFTAPPNESEILEAMHLGVMGLVLKNMSPHLLVQCVRKVHAGERWLERTSSGAVMEKLIRREAAIREMEVVLTPREMAIVNLAAHSLRNKDIASQLHIAEGTVKLHLHNIYDKLRVKGRASLALLAQQRGLLEFCPGAILSAFSFL